jgi:hypothetical protein
MSNRRRSSIWYWQGASNGAALEAARRVAKMVEKIETFILGLGEDLFFSRWKLEEMVFFFVFFLIETLNCVD